MSPKIVGLATIGVFIGSLIVVTFVYFTSRVGGESGPDWLYVIPFMFAFSGIVVWFMTVTNVFVIKNEPREYAKLAVLVIGIVLITIMVIKIFQNSASIGGYEKGSGRVVLASEFGEKWPFTVGQGVVDCVPHKGAIFIWAGQTFALNGVAKGMGYKDLWEIWRNDPDISGLKVGIGDMIHLALEQC